jgi:hypothetical protein
MTEVIEVGSRKTEDRNRRTDDRGRMTEGIEVGSGTRRRPKRTGLPSSLRYAAIKCRGKDAGVGNIAKMRRWELDGKI